jgi:hypothetical protein
VQGAAAAAQYRFTADGIQINLCAPAAGGNLLLSARSGEVVSLAGGGERVVSLALSQVRRLTDRSTAR